MRAASRPALEIRLLGALDVLREGRPVALPPSRKTRALLAYLAATGRAHPREHLCDLLWEGRADPRAALRWGLSKLRPLLDDARATRLVAEGDRVALRLEGAEVDLVAARRAAGADPETTPVGTLERAAARFRGPFLAGLHLAHCPRFDAWCTAQREAARRLHDALLAALVGRLAERPEEALRHACARLALDPAHEPAHLDVARLLAALGRRPEARDQLDRCRRALAEEGVAPSPALEAMRRALAPPATTSTPPKPAPPPRPLVGRRHECDVMDEAVRAAARGEAGDVLLVVGVPGIGKTRLLDELGARVRAAGGRVLAGRAFEAETTRPYGLWTDVLGALAPSGIPATLRPALAPLLPDPAAAPAPPDDDGAAGRARLFEAVARLLADYAADAPPLALVLDDVQWMDEASAALLHAVARRAAGTGLLVAAAARQGELDDHPAARRLLRALRRERRLRRLALGPLDADATARLVRGVAPALDAARVFSESAGNPLFALELARARRAGDDALPATLDGLIGDRLDALDPEARALVPWAAALGHGFDLDLLGRVAERSPAALVEAVEGLERRGILAPRGAGHDFAHDLIREVAYRRLSEPRRRMIHRRIARVLDAAGDPALASEVARHAARGGDAEGAARACLRAGEHALWVYAYREAAALAGRGLLLLDALPPQARPALRLGLLALFVPPGMASHRPPGLQAALSEALAEAQAAGLPAEVQRGFDAVATLHYQNGDFGPALDLALRAEAAGRAADPATVVRAVADAARCLGMIEREMPRAARLAREAEALARSAGHEPHEVPQALGHVHHHAGRLDEAAACFARAARLARQERNPWRAYFCLARLPMIALERGRPAEARARCRDLLPLAAKMGEGSEAPFAAALDALARLGLDEAGAAEALDRAVERLRAVDSRWMIAYVQNLAGTIDRGAGRAGRARRRAAEALDTARVVGRVNEAVLARALLAHLALDAGDGPAASCSIEEIRADAAWPDDLSTRARAAAEAVADRLEKTTPPPTPAPTPSP